MPQIDTDSALINAIRLAEQSGDPAVPGTGGWKLYVKSGGLYIQKHDGTVIGPLAIASGGGIYSAYLLYQDQKAQNTHAGDLIGATWNIRTLNTEVADSGNHGALASNVITLDAGTYDVEASAPAYGMSTHQLRLYNTTASAVLMYGQNSKTNPGSGIETHAFLRGSFTIGVSSGIRLDHWCDSTQSSFGAGVLVNAATEIYASLALWKRS